MKRAVRSLVVCLVVFWGIGIGWADIEDLARFHFESTAESNNWFEGFAEAVDGQEISYNCHRSESAKARIVRASDGKMSMQWRTAPVPKNWDGDSATFLWVCGLGNNLGNKEFYLYVNDKHRFTFRTLMDKHWAVEGRGGGTLEFTATESDQWGDLFGYMKLTVPAAWLTAGEPLLIKVVGEAAKHRAWVMTFEYADALAYFQTTERKIVYNDVSFWHLGEARIKLAARSDWVGKSVALRSKEGIIGEAVFGAGSDISVATIKIPRHAKPTPPRQSAIVVDGKPVGSVEMPDINEMRMKAFLDEELLFDRHVFPPGGFPKVDWKRPGMVDNEVGEFDLKVTFYNADMEPVDVPKEAGRYGAVVNGVTPAGYGVRRYITLYCSPEEWVWWRDKINIDVKSFAPLGISADVWQAHQDSVDEAFGSWILHRGLNDAGAAAFLAGLNELDAAKSDVPYKSNPWYLDRQWWVTFKRREFGVVDKYPPLARPVKLKRPEGTALKVGDPASVGYREEHIKEIRRICKEWAEEAGEPLATLVAHKGVIVFHEAFGTTTDGKEMTLETPTWMASITKLLTGCLMMQFVDQGLIGLDDPVKKYLPELDRDVNKHLTIRHLFTHTNGFWGHGTWGADWSSSLENVVGQYLPYLKVGEKHQYNGIGYALAGKVMERVSGKAIPYLFQEHLFQPLGAKHTKIEGTAGDSFSICLDIARVGQMLLNRGSYGEYRFFSEETFDKMLPVKLDQLVPGLETEWGIGVTWSGGTGLSKKTIGHGAASGAILRIDPEHELVIVSCRNTPGGRYGEFASPLIEACVAPLISQTTSPEDD